MVTPLILNRLNLPRYGKHKPPRNNFLYTILMLVSAYFLSTSLLIFIMLGTFLYHWEINHFFRFLAIGIFLFLVAYFFKCIAEKDKDDLYPPTEV